MRQLAAIEERVGATRLLLVAIAIVLAWSSWGEHWLSGAEEPAVGATVTHEATSAHTTSEARRGRVMDRPRRRAGPIRE